MFTTLIGTASLLNFAVTANGLPALFTPIAKLLAQGNGIRLTTVLMI